MPWIQWWFSCTTSEVWASMINLFSFINEDVITYPYPDLEAGLCNLMLGKEVLETCWVRDGNVIVLTQTLARLTACNSISVCFLSCLCEHFFLDPLWSKGRCALYLDYDIRIKIFNPDWVFAYAQVLFNEYEWFPLLEFNTTWNYHWRVLHGYFNGTGVILRMPSASEATIK